MVYLDLNIINIYGVKAALIIERLFFLTESKRCENPRYTVIDGRNWWDSTNVTGSGVNWWLDQFDAATGQTMSKSSFKYSRKQLEDDGLIDVVSGADHFRMAINFDRLREVVGDEAFTRYEDDRGQKSTPLDSQGVENEPLEGSNLNPLPEVVDDKPIAEGSEINPSDDSRGRELTSQGSNINPSRGRNLTPSLYMDESKTDESNDEKESSIEDGDALTLTPHQALVEMFYEVTFGCVPDREKNPRRDFPRVNKQISSIAETYEKPTAEIMEAWLAWRVFLDTWNKDASMPTKPSDVLPTWPRFLQFHKKDPNWLHRFESKYPGWRDYIFDTCNPTELRQKIQASVSSRAASNSKLRNYQRGIHEQREMIPMTEEEIRAAVSHLKD